MANFRSKTFLSDWLRENMPTRQQMEGNRFIKPFAHRVLRSELWRFTRRSVPRGVALGMLVGVIVPFAQILFAALLSTTVKANVPVAALTTFVTNPFTTPAIWVAAYWIGSWMLRVDAATIVAPVNTAIEETELQQFLEWLTGATMVTAFGLVIIAIVSAAISYLLAVFLWRWWIARKWARRKARRLEEAVPTE
ncbi:DUF2062 domain-containing protein [Altererythrobacter sp. Root672]|uniref:DUF2062 domain-containing protein n=1 Tax=Altererythrobacter sp. Root672 TaxID=1736584 RepID=UPI0006FAB25D|nr:DUF2062 domain-containing protein [Altererythrobacter sp. Root672]KRA83048.1 hypothetical protein ASD76_02940 [Altererythrobacter sp. Root672]